MPRLKICVCTSNAASAEPRAPKHAIALAEMSKDREVTFLDCLQRGKERVTPEAFIQVPNLTYNSYFFPSRNDGLLELMLQKVKHSALRGLFAAFGLLTPSIVSTRAPGLAMKLKEIAADVYVVHTIDALLPVFKMTRDRNPTIIFDCQEFYSDVGDGQSPLDREIIRRIECEYLPLCNLVLTTSDRLADALVEEYGITRPLPLYNTPAVEFQLPPHRSEGFSLYWRNATIGLGQRGLGDALEALTHLPDEISLHIQGRLPSDGGTQLRRTIEDLGLVRRVIIHPPYPASEAVIAARPYTVGLCLERKGIRNHDLTVSNKIFDYLMAGLAVVASDLPGLRDVITRSGGGLLYKSGCSHDLVEKIKVLYENRALLRHLARSGRAFALREGNLEIEMKKLRLAFDALVLDKMVGQGIANRPYNRANYFCT